MLIEGKLGPRAIALGHIQSAFALVAMARALRPRQARRLLDVATLHLDTAQTILSTLQEPEAPST